MRSPGDEFREFCPLAPQEIAALTSATYVLDKAIEFEKLSRVLNEL